MSMDFVLIMKLKDLDLDHLYVCWILTICWFKFDHIRFLMAVFHVESEGLPMDGDP
jgi:hypothetical protein